VYTFKYKGNASEMQPTAWGWKDCGGKLMPVLTDLQPALDELLKNNQVQLSH